MATYPATNKLMKTRWYRAAREDYGIRVKACESLGAEPEAFETIAVEILNTPEDKRDWLLTSEPVANYQPFVRFAQYATPRVDELAGLSGRRK